MFAIRNKKDKRWVYGTDYRSNPPKQRLSNNRALLFEEQEDALLELDLRKMSGQRYEVVEVKLEEVV